MHEITDDRGDISMKKGKELLFFIVPFILLCGLLVLCFAFRPQGAGFFSTAQYLSAFMKDAIFVRALINTFAWPIVMAVLSCLIYKTVSIKARKKGTIKRKTDYIILFLLAVLVSGVYFFVTEKLRYDIYYTGTIALINCIFILQIGAVVTFLFWLAELITERRKNRQVK